MLKTSFVGTEGEAAASAWDKVCPGKPRIAGRAVYVELTKAVTLVIGTCAVNRMATAT